MPGKLRLLPLVISSSRITKPAAATLIDARANEGDGDEESGYTANAIATRTKKEETTLAASGSKRKQLVNGQADGGPQAVRVMLVVETETSVWGSGGAACSAAAASATAPANDDSSDEELGHTMWRSSCMGNAAVKEATMAAAASSERERLASEGQTMAFNRDSACCASTLGKNADTSNGHDSSKSYREQDDGSDDLRRDNNDPLAGDADADGPRPSAGDVTLKAPRPAPCKVPRAALSSKGRGKDGSLDPHDRVARLEANGFQADQTILPGRYEAERRRESRGAAARASSPVAGMPTAATATAAPVAMSNVAMSKKGTMQQAKWNDKCSKLEAYHTCNGHCNVPKSSDHALRSWVKNQHMALKHGTLKPDRVACLNRIGFQADQLAEIWSESYSKLEAYHASNGHCNVPQAYQADRALGVWVSHQRIALNHGTLNPDQVSRLNRIGVKTDRRTEKWNEQWNKLEAYRARNHHCNVPSKYQPDSAWGLWVSRQRMALRDGTLEPDPVARLDSIGFQVVRRGGRPRSNHVAMKDVPHRVARLDANGFQADQTFIPGRYEAERRRESRGAVARASSPIAGRPTAATAAAATVAMSNVAMSKKEAMQQAKWNDKCSKLEAYHACNGHCNVPKSSDHALRGWVKNQRMALKSCILEPDRAARLNRIGFQADQLAEIWSESYSKLEAYHASNGHCNVPQAYQANRGLGIWVKNQRIALKHGTLKPDRVARLDRIGFQADQLAEIWSESYSKLEAYHASNGHCNVPQAYQADRALGVWVSRQRIALKHGTLNPDRVSRLNRIGVKTDRRTEKWNEQWNKLEAYRARNHHCNVPSKYQPDSALGLWVSRQRMALRDGTLEPDRVARLDSIGFQVVRRGGGQGQTM